MENLNWTALSKQRIRPDAKRGNGSTLIEHARRRAEREPDAEAFLSDGVRTSYAEVLKEAEQLAASLWELGMRPGDVLSFQLPNWTEAAAINLAACMLGLVCNPIVPIYRDAELAMILSDSRSRVLFVAGEWRGYDYAAMAQRLKDKLPGLHSVVSVRDSRPGVCSYAELVRAGAGRAGAYRPVAPADVKLIMYTSGTTGRAKGVLHSHRSLPVAVDAAFAQWGIAAGDVILMPSPVTHITGYCCGLEMPFSLGTRTVLMDRWDAQQAVTLIDDHGVSATVGATPFLQELVAAAQARKSTLPSLKVFACGGAAVPPELVRKANAQLAGRVFRVYGSTEAPLITFGSRPDDVVELRANTDGRLNGYDVRLAGLDGKKQLPPGSEGEIVVQGDGLFLGYADPAQTAESFDDEGYFTTGDLGILGDDGTLTITGRKKDLIIRGGENISAKEIEDILHRHPAIREAAAVAMPHARLGEGVCVYVIPQAGAVLSQPLLAAFVSDAGLAKQKCPERLELVEDFPRTPSGKIRKDILRKMIAEKLAPGLHHAAPAASPV